jgi:hypothetical protein
MPITETTRDVSAPSSLRTELNIAAAVVAVGLCLLILALFANTQSSRAAHHPRPGAHVARHAPAAPRS